MAPQAAGLRLLLASCALLLLIHYYSSPVAATRPLFPSLSSDDVAESQPVADALLLSDIPPDMVRAEIQSSLQSFANALQANKTAEAAAIFAPEVWLLAPGKPQTNLSDPESQLAFLDSLKAAGLRIVLTISDMLLSKSASAASNPAENSDPISAATSLVYVVINSKGKMVTVGKAIVVWTVAQKEVAADAADPGVEGKKKKGSKWKLTWAMWNDDLAKDGLDAAPSLSSALSAASAQAPVNCARSSEEKLSAAVAARAVTGGSRAAVLRQLQQQAEDLSAALADGDCATIQGVLNPEITLLPPHEPPRTTTRLESMKQLFQNLVCQGLTLNLTIDDAIPFHVPNPSVSSAAARETLGSDAGRVALSRGSFVLTNLTNDDILAHGTTMLLWAPVPEPSLSASRADLPAEPLADPPLRFALQWIMWSATPGKGPSPPAPPSLHSPALQEPAALRDPSPEEVRPFVLRKVRDFLSAIAINDSASAATVFAPSALAIGRDKGAQLLDSDEAKRAFAQRIANKKLDIEFSLTELIVGATEDPKFQGAYNEAVAGEHEFSRPASNNDVSLLLTRFTYTASKASGVTADVGKVVAVWVGVGKLPYPEYSSSRVSALKSDPINWKLSWLVWNSNPAPAAVSAIPAALISSAAVPPALRDPKPGPVLEVLQARLKALADALALGDAEGAVDVLAEGAVLALPPGSAETVAETAEEKRALVQSLVSPGTHLSLTVSGVRLADFAFPKPPKPAHSAPPSNEDLLYALSWGDYSASVNGSVAASGSFFVLWRRDQRKVPSSNSSSDANVGGKTQAVYGIVWAMWTHAKTAKGGLVALAATAEPAEPLPLASPHPEDVRPDLASLLPRLSSALSLAPTNASALLALLAPCVTLLPPNSPLLPAVCADERAAALAAFGGKLVQLTAADLVLGETVPGKKKSVGGMSVVGDPKGHVAVLVRVTYVVLSADGTLLLDAGKGVQTWEQQAPQLRQQQQEEQEDKEGEEEEGVTLSLSSDPPVWVLTTFAWNSDVAAPPAVADTAAAAAVSAAAEAGAETALALESAANGGGEAKQVQAALTAASAAVASGDVAGVLRALSPSGAAVLPPNRPLLWIDASAGSQAEAEAALAPMANFSCTPNVSLASFALLRSLEASLSAGLLASSHHHQSLALTTGNFSCAPVPHNDSSLEAKAKTRYGSFVAVWEQSTVKGTSFEGNLPDANPPGVNSDKRPWFVKWVLWSNAAPPPPPPAPPAPAPAPASEVAALEPLLASS